MASQESKPARLDRAVSSAQRISTLRAADGVLGLATSVAPALGGQGLVVVLAKVHAELLPGVEVALGGDGAAAGALVDAVGDVLGEGGGADDGRLVDLGVLPDVVRRAVAGHGADLLALGRAGAVGGVLLDVVLDERVGGPAVDGDEDGAGGGGGGALEVDLAVRAGLPALADDEVTGVAEVDRVAVVGGLEVDVAGGLVVLVVVLAAHKGAVLDGELEVGGLEAGGGGVGGRGGEGASDGGEGNSHGGEGNHFEEWMKMKKRVSECVFMK
jgi:hypothetical protein